MNVKCIRKVCIDVLAVGRPEKPIQVEFRCADGCHGEVSAIATGDNKEKQRKEEVAMIVDTDARVNPAQRRHTRHYIQGVAKKLQANGTSKSVTSRQPKLLTHIFKTSPARVVRWLDRLGATCSRA